ncbi:bacteriohopanetetrol glucosamine biosynthesis glycosyltransferase HpnI [Desulforhabdus sp. TSK]|uniref:bacteriohopanetetrol glucosamine biosynthesis glycosyltransferase HpnI n=1 Tax=Desulforhabdus sp. TSK TaxID=2925014 RepID=UPI001FC83E43|nr:bacteriohopanetetrol glucosamine biosynthesis glycosyltransferase HpnI [Desulforhabdus sp. TSK]GKT08288.1 ceramide glucosyltransferase [Desulforhabdus sp. TSK]
MGPGWIDLLLTALTSCSILYYCLCIAAARRFFAAKPSTPVGVFPPATLLIPLCGSDFKAYENYASFCRQEYPAYQIVFGVQHPEDSSIEVVRKLMADFPQADMDLVIDSRCIGVNPKVNNLHNMLAKAKYDVLVIVDSDIRVKPDYLVTLIPPTQDERVGLVTTFYRTGEAPSLAAKIEALGITAEFAPGVLAARLAEGMSFALGATMALTREKLEAIGGFEAIAHYLADDFMLGNLLWKAGFEIRLLPYTVETFLPPSGMRKMFRHQVRWARGIRACRPWGHTGSLVTHGTVLAILNALVHGGSPSSLGFFVLAVSARLAMAWTVGVQMLGDRILARNFHLLPLRGIFSFAVWMVSLVGKKVEWRGRFYRIVENGKIVPMKSAGE